MICNDFSHLQVVKKRCETNGKAYILRYVHNGPREALEVRASLDIFSVEDVGQTFPARWYLGKFLPIQGKQIEQISR